MLLLGIDVGTSSIKVAIVDAHSQQCITTAQYPEVETPITCLQKGWAEQDPEMWWENVQQAITPNWRRCSALAVHLCLLVLAVCNRSIHFPIP